MPRAKSWKRLVWIMLWTAGTGQAIKSANQMFSASSAEALNLSATSIGLRDEFGRQIQVSAEPARGSSTPVFGGSVTSEESCAFIPGYFAFLPETTVAVSSVAEFMPDMKVAIATSPSDFHVFTRLDSRAVSQKARHIDGYTTLHIITLLGCIEEISFGKPDPCGKPCSFPKSNVFQTEPARVFSERK